MTNFLFVCVYVYVFIFYENDQNVLGKLGHQNTKELTLLKKPNSWCLEWRCLRRGLISEEPWWLSWGLIFSIGIVDEWWESCPHHFVFSPSFIPPSIAKIIIWQSLFFLFLQQGWQDAQGSWFERLQIRIKGEVISIERGWGGSFLDRYSFSKKKIHLL